MNIHGMLLIVVAVLIAELVKMLVKCAWSLMTEDGQPLQGAIVIMGVIFICAGIVIL